MSPANVVISLRPSGQSASAIADALARAKIAAAEQQASVARAKAARDDALLDASPDVLKQAEKVLADAREQGERIDAVTAHLMQRHAVAVEQEAAADVESLKVTAEQASAALAKWWTATRKRLSVELAEGVRLMNLASSARHDHAWERKETMDRYPGRLFPAAATPKVDASAWAEDLGNRLRLAQDDASLIAGIETMGDPEPLPSPPAGTL